MKEKNTNPYSINIKFNKDSNEACEKLANFIISILVKNNFFKDSNSKTHNNK